MKIAILGDGTIGSAIAEGLRKERCAVTVTRRTIEKIRTLEKLGITVMISNEDAAKSSDIIVVALKPYDSLKVLARIAEFAKGKFLISMVAAIKESRIKSLVPEAKVVRATTNVAAKVAGGYIVFCSNGLDEKSEKEVVSLFNCLGETERVEERHMGALTAISGSGPTYIFAIIEAMIYAGLKVGLPESWR